MRCIFAIWLLRREVLTPTRLPCDGDLRLVARCRQQIYEDQSLVNVEDNIAPVKEVFRLQRDHELREAEGKYLPKV